MAQKIALFDLDGTILKGISSENAFILHLLRKRHIGVKQIFLTLLFIFRWFPKYKFHCLVKNKAYLTGLNIDAVAQLGRTFVQTYLLPKIKPHLRERIELHRRAGDRLVLLTGSPKFLAQEFSRHLNMDEVQATYCTHHARQFTCGLPTQHPFLHEKLSIAQQLAEQHHVDMKDIVAYGNSYNDRILLREVGKAVAVSPDRRLRKIARKLHWEIIE